MLYRFCAAARRPATVSFMSATLSRSLVWMLRLNVFLHIWRSFGWTTECHSGQQLSCQDYTERWNSCRSMCLGIVDARKWLYVRMPVPLMCIHNDALLGLQCVGTVQPVRLSSDGRLLWWVFSHREEGRSLSRICSQFGAIFRQYIWSYPI